MPKLTTDRGMEVNVYSVEAGTWMSKVALMRMIDDATREDRFDYREWSIVDAETLERLAAMIRKGYERKS